MDSLPLMGSGNVALPGSAATWRAGRLITPHGEWERGKQAVDRILSFDALPLMGSGNFRGTGCVFNAHLLSLPLMGSGEPGRSVAAGCVSKLNLITPHGEWEPSFYGEFSSKRFAERKKKRLCMLPYSRLSTGPAVVLSSSTNTKI